MSKRLIGEGGESRGGNNLGEPPKNRPPTPPPITKYKGRTSMIDRNKLDSLIKEIDEKCNRYDFSDEYLSENGHTTRDEVGIGEYVYGITMIPCEYIKPYLNELQEIYHGTNKSDIDVEKLNDMRENLYDRHREDGLEDRCYKAIDGVFVALNNKDEIIDKLASFIFHNHYKMIYVDEIQFKKKKEEIINGIMHNNI